ncbi:MAG: D-2-hydroxyacid dehydrogenase [Steroidobacteraceae bacterium]|nr:D-2-hydroxyacid dehydrogenase [Steroidobacteraceae bacterium]MCC7199597.1 D-2-hydroxyacid dehydrogenase [Gammaproteobacteria bacterium]
MRACFLDLGTVSNGDLDTGTMERALPGLEIHQRTAQEDVATRIAGVEVILANKSRITRAMMEANPQLKLIALTATGVDNVDVVAAREHGVAVCNLRDYCTPSVVQHVFATLLALTHKVREYDAFVKRGGWSEATQFSVFPFPVRELQGRTLGIVGYGCLGKGVARVAEAFGMRVLVANRPGGAPEIDRVDLDALLPEADVLSLHCPLTADTRGLISAERLARMKPDAVLINTARGALVDAHALAEALRAGRLGGAAIDVLEKEPPVNGNPLLDASIPNLIVTPHTAWAARESRQRCLDELAANVVAFRRGEKRNRVV